MKLFKKKDKNIEAEENLAKNAESDKNSRRMAKMPVQQQENKRGCP